MLNLRPYSQNILYCITNILFFVYSFHWKFYNDCEYSTGVIFQQKNLNIKRTRKGNIDSLNNIILTQW